MRGAAATVAAVLAVAGGRDTNGNAVPVMLESGLRARSAR